METSADNPSLAIPPDLAARILAEADREHRPAEDVLRALVEHGLAERVKPMHRERTVFRSEELSEARVKAITEGRMDPRHDYLNAELE